MIAKDKWLIEIQNSLNGIQSVEVNPYLYSKILNRIGKKQEIAVPIKWALLSASAFLLLFILNIFIFKSVNNSPSKDDLKTLSTTFKLFNENNVNYN